MPDTISSSVSPPATFQTSTTSFYTSTTSKSYPSSTTPSFLPMATNSKSAGVSFWDNMGKGVKAVMVIGLFICLVIITVGIVWCFCCGGRQKLKLDRQERRARMIRQARMGAAAQNTAPVPLRPLHSSHSNLLPTSSGHVHSPHHPYLSPRAPEPASGGDAPPRYEEVVPPAHQRLAGGMRNNTARPRDGTEEEDGMAVVADGKTPLSEIPFEDVVLEPVRSEASSSRDFGAAHARGGGDTTGHTNS